MVTATTISKLLKNAKLGQESLALTAAQVSKDQLQTISLREYNYDFVGLVTKLVVYFTLSLLFAKFMEAVILGRGFYKTLANLFGYNIPASTEFPKFLVDLFGEEGIKGFKFWDIVKIGAILMVLFEFMRYSKNNPSTKNALTIGLFVGIIVALGLTTLPELIKRVKTTDFDLESLR
jgi:hypothetical protein